MRMTVEEADERFYPNSYVMINCEWDTSLIVAGEVVAYAPLKHDGSLSRLKHELAVSGKYGDVFLNLTKDPLDGGSLLVEYCDVN